MKKSTILVLIAIVSISFASTGSAVPKFIKNAKDKITGKEKKKSKKNATVVLVKGLQLTWCGKEVKDNGSVTIPGLKGVALPVKGGRFDLAVPVNPVFGDEFGLSQQSQMAELSFGNAKVYLFSIISFANSSTSEVKADGRGGIAFRIIYSDKNVRGTIDGKAASLKKGWNIIGDKKNREASLMCAG